MQDDEVNGIGPDGTDCSSPAMEYCLQAWLGEVASNVGSLTRCHFVNDQHDVISGYSWRFQQFDPLFLSNIRTLLHITRLLLHLSFTD